MYSVYVQTKQKVSKPQLFIIFLKNSRLIEVGQHHQNCVKNIFVKNRVGRREVNFNLSLNILFFFCLDNFPLWLLSLHPLGWAHSFWRFLGPRLGLHFFEIEMKLTGKDSDLSTVLARVRGGVTI